MSRVLRALCPWVVVLVCAVAVGCGGHSTSPTAPSSSTPASPSASPTPAGQGATINGTIASLSGAVSGIVVGVSGTTLSSTSDAAGNFSIANVPPANVVLTFSAPGISASASVGSVAAGASVHVDVTISGSVATVNTQQNIAPDNSVEADGTIADINSSSRQFRFGSVTVTVPATASITRDGAPAAFGDLRNGDRAHVHGTKDGSGVRASQVDATSATPTPPPTTDVTLSGTAASVAGTCPALTLTVQGTTVKTTGSTTFDGTKGCSVLANGDTVTVVGAKQSDGSVVASRLTNATAPPPPPPADVTLNGALSGLRGTCPALSMTVAGTVVTTNTATVFTNKSCGELKNGDLVYAVGPKQSDGSVLASKIYYTPSTVTLTGTVSNLGGAWPVFTLTVQGTAVKTSSATTCDGTKGCSEMANGDSVTVVGTTESDGSVLASKITNATPPPVDVYVKGAIAGLTGTCPALTMTVGGSPVKTSSATTFNGKSCSELKNGDVIYAAGPKQADGTILANRIYYTPPTVTLTGTVTNLGGAWPVLTLTVQGTAVKTSSATTCDGTKGCSEMANGDSVTVVGTTESDGSLLASKITNATPPPVDVYVNGAIAGLTGTCPALTMTVGGSPVKTSSATTFNGKSCLELKNGDVIYAAGPKQADGTILANRIYYTPPTVTLTGTVSSLGGAWPVLTLTVQGTAVKTSSATTCDGTKGCSLMANGDSVTVVGTTQSDGSVLASKITNATPPPPADTTLNGVVAALAGTCPALTMTVAGSPVKTSSATAYTGLTCADLKNGTTIYAIGPKQTDGSVLASNNYMHM